jgi:hypothetical protein
MLSADTTTATAVETEAVAGGGADNNQPKCGRDSGRNGCHGKGGNDHGDGSDGGSEGVKGGDGSSGYGSDSGARDLSPC